MTQLQSAPIRDPASRPPLALRIVAVVSLVLGLISVGFRVMPDLDIVGLVLDVLLVVVGIGLLGRQPWARITGAVVHGFAAAVGVVWTVIATSHAVASGTADAWLGVMALGAPAAFSIWALIVLRSRPVRGWFEPRRHAARGAA